MQLLSSSALLDHLASESRALRDALGRCDPEAQVPSCPDWTAHDLLAHVVSVQEFWTGIVRDRPAGPPEDHEDADLSGSAYDALLDRLGAASAALIEALTGLPDDEPAWTWSDDPADHCARFIVRRQALEALVHRIDADQTAGTTGPVDALLAADGVLEVLDVMYGGAPNWGRREPSEQLLRMDVTDTGHQFWLRLGTFSGVHPGTGDELAGEQDFQVVGEPADHALEPDAVVDGSAEKLLAWLWHREDRAGVSMTGAPEVLAHVLAVLEHPID